MTTYPIIYVFYYIYFLHVSSTVSKHGKEKIICRGPSVLGTNEENRIADVINVGIEEVISSAPLDSQKFLKSDQVTCFMRFDFKKLYTKAPEYIVSVQLFNDPRYTTLTDKDVTISMETGYSTCAEQLIVNEFKGSDQKTQVGDLLWFAVIRTNPFSQTFFKLQYLKIMFKLKRKSLPSLNVTLTSIIPCDYENILTFQCAPRLCISKQLQCSSTINCPNERDESTCSQLESKPALYVIIPLMILCFILLIIMCNTMKVDNFNMSSSGAHLRRHFDDSPPAKIRKIK